MKQFIFLLFLSVKVLAQTYDSSYTRVNGYFSKKSILTTQDSLIDIAFPTLASSIVLKIPNGSSFDQAYIVADLDTVILKHDSHGDIDAKYASQLIVFRNPVNRIQIYTGEISGESELQIFNTTNSSFKKKENNYRTSDLCAEPVSISQTGWREGLPEPKGSPVNTSVYHIIIHHSAGSNLSSDYTEEVRSIYLYHTQSNRYDDIGYNYLIDPLGTIYKGRDGKGIVEQDNVRGAHMCNKNDSTMAICMLGTFTDVLPTQQALSSLYKLAGWKAAKNNMDVFSSSLHSQGPTSAGSPSKMLPVLAGHRDGCTPFYTECPGQSLYNFLPEVRRNVENEKSSCILTGLENENAALSEIRINGKRYVLNGNNSESITVYNTNGTILKVMPFKEKIEMELKGLYIFYIRGDLETKLKILLE